MAHNKIEDWKNIEGYKGLYEVSNLGRVKSLERTIMRKNGSPLFVKEKILNPVINNNGYSIVTFSKCGGSRKTFQVHQLVAISFLNHKPNGFGLVVNHKNFIRNDNRLENLEIVSMRKNTNQKHLKSSSKYVGVSWCNQTAKWRAGIRIKGKSKHLGRFNSEYIAHLAYQNKLKQITNG